MPVWEIVTEPVVITRKLSTKQARERAGELLKTVGQNPNTMGPLPRTSSAAGSVNASRSPGRCPAIRRSHPRRDGFRARRLDPRPDHEPAEGPAEAVSVDSFHDRPRPRHHSVHERQDSPSCTSARLSRWARPMPSTRIRLHPYTKALLSERSSPPARRARHPRRPYRRSTQPAQSASGCRFHTRCPAVMGHCSLQRPVLRELEPCHWVACYLYEEPSVASSGSVAAIA